MQRIAKFEKISYEEFHKYMYDNHKLPDVEIENLYNWIELPKRSTAGSAGYDFHMPFDVELSPGSTIKIPTGIRCRMEPGWVLKIYPRSSLGFKYHIHLDNTVGIIDADYYNASNEGHIIASLTNYGDKVVKLYFGDRFIQGVFVEFGITEDDEASGERVGGFGSTDKN